MPNDPISARGFARELPQGGLAFGRDLRAGVGALRDLADRMERGDCLVQRVTVAETASGEDFVTKALVLRFLERR